MNWQIPNNQQLIENIGWTLIHSVWQISLVAILLFCVLRILKNASANLRYLICVAALFSAFALPMATFIGFLSNKDKESKNISAGIIENKINKPNAVINNHAEILNDSSKSAETAKGAESNFGAIFETLQFQSQKLFTNFLPVFVWLWLFGLLCFTFRFCGGIWRTHKLKTHQNSLVDNSWENKFDVLCQTVGIYKPVKFLQSEIVTIPMAVGWLKPFVIVPSSVLLGLNPRELETIIVHELIHIRRHDYLVNILQSFIEIVLFFHPLMWWISALTRHERENACDDEVLQIFAGEPLLYANALANLEDFRTQANNLTPSNILAANGGSLMLRIQRIINNAQMKNSKGSIWSSGLAFLLTFVISVSLFSISWHIGINSDEEVTTNIDAKRVAIAVYSNSQYLVIEDIKDADETMSLLTDNLKRLKIPVVGYENGSGNVRVNDTKARNEKIISLWRDAGFEIGWGNFKFPKSFDKTMADYQRVYESRPTFKGAISSAVIEKIREQTGYPKRLTEKPTDEQIEKFRKAFSDISNEDKEKMQKEFMDSMASREAEERQWLKENNLKSTTFTIDSVDWTYSNIYDSARQSNDKKLMKYVQDQYLEYLSKIFDYYEATSQQTFNRKIPQTFGLEPCRLVADSMDRIVEMLNKRGYEFISMDEALKDEAFQLNGNNFGGKSSFFDSLPFLKKRDSTEKPIPNENIMTAWYGKDSKN